MKSLVMSTVLQVLVMIVCRYSHVMSLSTRVGTILYVLFMISWSI